MAYEKFPVSINAVLADPDASLLAGWDQIQVHRSTTGSAGPYAELTTALTRMPVVSEKYEYVFVDDDGAREYYYKSRLYNSSTLAVDTFSVPAPGAVDPALDIVSIQQLKDRYLFGIDLTDDSGTPYPDSLFEHYIASAVSKVEHELDMPLTATTYDEEQDYIREDYRQYIWMELDKYPVISLEKVELVLPGNQTAQDFPADWFQLNKETGQLQLIPGQNSAGVVALGAFSGYLPNVAGSRRFIPNTFRVQYTAGFAAGSVPKMVEDVVGKIAAFGPLNIAGDLLGGAGIASQSVSLDGLSTTFNTTSSATSAGYGARLIQYTKEIKDDMKKLRAFYKRVSLGAI